MERRIIDYGDYFFDVGGGYFKCSKCSLNCASEDEMIKHFQSHKAQAYDRMKPVYEELVEALRVLLTLHDEDCKMLDRGIGTATPQGQKISKARQALAKADQLEKEMK